MLLICNIQIIRRETQVNSISFGILVIAFCVLPEDEESLVEISYLLVTADALLLSLMNATMEKKKKKKR